MGWKAGEVIGTPGAKNQIQKLVAVQQGTGQILISSLPDLESRKKVLLSYLNLELRAKSPNDWTECQQGQKTQISGPLIPRPKQRTEEEHVYCLIQ